MSEAIIFFISVFFVCCLYWIKRRKLLKHTSKFRGPKPYPIIGNGNMFLWKNNEEKLKIVNDLFRIYESPCVIWFGPEPVIFIDKPEDIQIVLNSPNCLGKADLYKFFNCENGLFSATNTKKWKMHRKLLNPCFNQKILNGFVEFFNNKSRVLVKRMNENLGKKLFDVTNYIGGFTLDSIVVTSLGMELDLQSVEGDNFLKVVDECIELIQERVYNFWLHPNFIYKWTHRHKREKELYEIGYGITRKVMSFKKEEAQVEKPKNYEEIRKPKVYIEQLYELKKNGVFSDTEVKDEIDTIIMGGNETSTLTLSNLILMLAIHQDVQEKVYQEIIEEVGQNEVIQANMLNGFPYMEKVIKEVMRLFPVGPMIARKCDADTKISSNLTIPAKSTVVLGIYSAHHNPQYWGTNPFSFNPNNFAENNAEKRHPYSFVPFSSGPRNCIGYKYAWMQMKIVLCHLLRHYKFTSPLSFKDIKIKVSITLRLVNKRLVQIEERVKTI